MMKHSKDGDYAPSYFELAASIYRKYGILELLNKATKKAFLWAKKKYFKASYFYFWFNYKNADLAKKTPNLRFYFDDNQRTKIKDFYDRRAKLSQRCVSDANRIINHQFNILGSTLNAGSSINWSKDHKADFLWSKQFYQDIVTIDLSNNADVKNVWELSRFNHLFTLGKAYWITNDTKYYEETKKQIINWEQENSLYKSVNWTCTMEVAIRSINWIFSYFHFKDEIDEDSDFKNLLNKLLYFHGEYIANNLENYNKLRNNHYVANLVGLLFLGLYFNENQHQKNHKWIKFAVKELHREIKVQINEDGTSYESSTNYQRVVGELFLHAYLIGNLNGINFDDEYIARLKKIHTFLALIEKPNGFTPLVGDIDNGRLLIISKYFNWDKRNFSDVYDLAINALDLNIPKTNQQNDEELIWLKYWESNPIASPIEKEKSLAFEDGGYYLLKNSYFYSFVRCGELSMKGQGGHSHNDQLSFELNVQGQDFIIDPGSYTYTGSKKLRNKDRCTSSHNTVCIDGSEQNDLPADLFSMPEQTFAKKIKFDSNFFIGEHYGYKANLGITHQRKINLDRKTITIVDRLIGKALKKNAYINLILDPNVLVNTDEQYLRLTSSNIELITNIPTSDSIISEWYVARGYGERVKSNKIQYKINPKTKVEVQFSLT